MIYMNLWVQETLWHYQNAPLDPLRPESLYRKES